VLEITDRKPIILFQSLGFPRDSRTQLPHENHSKCGPASRVPASRCAASSNHCFKGLTSASGIITATTNETCQCLKQLRETVRGKIIVIRIKQFASESALASDEEVFFHFVVVVANLMVVVTMRVTMLHRMYLHSFSNSSEQLNHLLF